MGFYCKKLVCSEFTPIKCLWKTFLILTWAMLYLTSLEKNSNNVREKKSIIFNCSECFLVCLFNFADTILILMAISLVCVRKIYCTFSVFYDRELKLRFIISIGQNLYSYKRCWNGLWVLILNIQNLNYSMSLYLYV